MTHSTKKITVRLGKCLYNCKKCNSDDHDDNYLTRMITFIKRLTWKPDRIKTLHYIKMLVCEKRRWMQPYYVCVLRSELQDRVLLP